MPYRKGQTLIEYVGFRKVNFKAIPAHGESVWGPAHYVAFTLLCERPDDVRMIDLGDANVIDNAITMFRKYITRELEENKGRHLDALSFYKLNQQPDNTGSGPTLRTTVFDPLLTALDGCNRLFIAPDGDLARLPFEILPVDDAHVLIDRYHIQLP